MAKKAKAFTGDRKDPKQNKSLAIRTVLKSMPSKKATEVAAEVKKQFGHAVSVNQISTFVSGPVQSSGNANPDNNFRFDAELANTGGYIFNLSTKGLSTGTYNLNFRVSGDSFLYSAPFQVK